jgi:hypothetical protein
MYGLSFSSFEKDEQYACMDGEEWVQSIVAGLLRSPILCYEDEIAGMMTKLLLELRWSYCYEYVAKAEYAASGSTRSE